MPSPGHLRGRSRQSCPRAIQLPPLSCPRSGPPQHWEFATRRPAHAAPYTPLKEDTSRPSRPEAVMSFGWPPSIFRIMIAIGQSSTDSVGAHGKYPMSLQATLIRSRCPAVQDHRVLRRQDGGNAPPKPEPAATWNGPRCTKNSALGWRSSGHETIARTPQAST